MKKLSVLLLLALTSFAQAQTTTTQQRVVDPVSKDTSLITTTAVTTATTSISSTAKVYRYNQVIPPPVVVPPVGAYNQTYRYSLATNAYKINQNGFVPGVAITSVPAAKGGVSLKYVGDPNPPLTHSSALYKNIGVLFFNNEPGVKYSAQISNKAPYPRELWIVLFKPNYFMSEQFMIDDTYIGDLGPHTLRTTNDNKDGFWFNQGVNIPVNGFSVFRERLTAVPGKTDYVNVEFWINGVKLTSPVQVKAWYRSINQLSVGTSTNSDYWGLAEFFTTPPLDDINQAPKVQAEIAAEYNIGKVVQLPYADNISFSYDQQGNKTVSYTYVNPLGIPEDKSKVQLHWITWGSGGVTTSSYLPQYDGKFTVPANSTGSGRIEIIVSDTAGNFNDVPQSASFSN